MKVSIKLSCQQHGPVFFLPLQVKEDTTVTTRMPSFQSCCDALLLIVELSEAKPEVKPFDPIVKAGYCPECKHTDCSLTYYKCNCFNRQ